MTTTKKSNTGVDDNKKSLNLVVVEQLKKFVPSTPRITIGWLYDNKICQSRKFGGLAFSVVTTCVAPNLRLPRLRVQILGCITSKNSPSRLARLE